MEGNDITRRPPHEIVEAGIALVPEDRGVFADLTVHENLVLGARPRRARARESGEHGTRALAVPEAGRTAPAVGADHERRRAADGGGRPRHDVGAVDPDAGRAVARSLPLLCPRLFRPLARVKVPGAGIFLVEQNAKQSLAIADRGYLLDNGHIVGADTAEALSKDEMVRTAYLGGGGGNLGSLTHTASDRMTERETKERREEAMAQQQLRFNCMHFMPYAHLPENHKDYKSLWVNFPNKYYDPEKGHALYQRI